MIFLLGATDITVDCFPLKEAKMGTKPLITMGVEEANNKIVYEGIGYSVETGNDITINETTYIEQLGYGAEFPLFDEIVIWVWIE